MEGIAEITLDQNAFWELFRQFSLPAITSRKNTGTVKLEMITRADISGVMQDPAAARTQQN